jgi:pyruvate/2-oxoglutarate dehydrogenase complex dihydrolipoamide acyltransferase (E2) component|tara:strand:+ start:243 stop:743 length:501 start_codon:yes stop_codon:yes gene_type:complete
MARVRQFAKDMGITYNQAKGLINKGRSRKDGGSQILENVMKKPVYAKQGKFTKAKVKIEKLLTESDKPKLRPKNLVKKKTKKKDPFAKDTTVILNEEFSKGVAEANRKAMEELKKAKGGAFPDLSGDGKITQKDILMGRGVIKKKLGGVARGGRSAIQGTGFSGVY